MPPSRSLSTTTTAPPPDSAAAESDFVIILAALLCALICVVGLVAAARCACLRRPSAGAAAKGLKKKALNSLPKTTFDAASAAAAGDCAICLAEYAAGDQIRILPTCGHSFHQSCVDTWLGAHSSCPSCRRILVVRCRKCGERELSLSNSTPSSGGPGFLPF